ncbi:hypothetical protein [Streptomyces sp. Z26]|uniref:hypothetical protein n=1 Tax=Streptomyces sp. Z26 TaxID=2500177 RepID=UPI000FCC4FAF|nr:hypothetical protein [Streptomyces sp. Z26]
MAKRLEIVEGVLVRSARERIPYTPRYSVSGLFVTLGPHVDLASHEQLLSSTFGSADWLWSGDDEFRFEKANRILTGVKLGTAEEGPVDARGPAAWLDLPCISGGLQAESEEDFAACPMASRWVSDDGRWLICAAGRELTPTAAFLRLRVAEFLDFVFADGVLVGWILESPARFLVREWESPPGVDCDPVLNVGLREFLSIVVEPGIEALQEGNPLVHSSLARLRGRLARIPADSRRDILIERIDDLTEEWPSSSPGSKRA